MDTLITVTGRDQAARGELDVKFASITDRQIVYSTGSNGVLDDLSNRIYVESYSTDNDTIIYEIDGNGYLQPFVSDNYTIYGGQAFDLTQSQTTESVGGSHGAVTFKPGSINIVSDEIISTSTKNFKRQMIIGSRDLSKYSKNSEFTLSRNDIDFTVSDSSPPRDVNTKNVDQIESVFQDSKFGNMLNYKYMAPRTKPMTNAPTGSLLANYAKINSNPIDTIEELASLLQDKPVEHITFNTSVSNNLLGQIFQVNFCDNTLEKLAIVDVGEYQVDNSVNPHVLYAGKFYRDGVGSLVFVCLFTIVMS
jgi:hypothetical protein